MKSRRARSCASSALPACEAGDFFCDATTIREHFTTPFEFDRTIAAWPIAVPLSESAMVPRAFVHWPDTYDRISYAGGARLPRRP